MYYNRCFLLFPYLFKKFLLFAELFSLFSHYNSFKRSRIVECKGLQLYSCGFIPVFGGKRSEFSYQLRAKFEVICGDKVKIYAIALASERPVYGAAVQVSVIAGFYLLLNERVVNFMAGFGQAGSLTVRRGKKAGEALQGLIFLSNFRKSTCSMAWYMI